jgi:hypothetical protein
VILARCATSPAQGHLRPYSLACGVWSVDSDVAEAELSVAMIAAVIAMADARVCVGNPRCYAFPDRLEDARETGTPKWLI